MIQTRGRPGQEAMLGMRSPWQHEEIQQATVVAESGDGGHGGGRWAELSTEPLVNIS